MRFFTNHLKIPSLSKLGCKDNGKIPKTIAAKINLW